MADVTNRGTIQFPTPTPAGWGTVTKFVLTTEASAAIAASNLIARRALVNSRTIGANDDVNFAAGELDITIPAGQAEAFGAKWLADGRFADPGTTIYIGLTDAADAEPTGNAYARVALTASDWAVSQ